MGFYTYLVFLNIGAGWINQSLTLQAFASLPGQRFVERTWFNILLTRQACTSLPGHRFLEPNWFKFGSSWFDIFDPASLYKLDGSKIFEPTWLKLVQQIVDPARLYKFAQACRVRYLLNQVGASWTILYLMCTYVYTCTILYVYHFYTYVYLVLCTCILYIYICIYMGT